MASELPVCPSFPRYRYTLSPYRYDPVFYMGAEIRLGSSWLLSKYLSG